MIGYLLDLIWPKLKQQPIEQNPLPFYLALLAISYMWESVEFYLEAGYSYDAVTYWFQGIEFWGNRIITDPLMMLIGAHTFLRHKKIVLYARIFSIIWLITHIFIFPHSMYLHELL